MGVKTLEIIIAGGEGNRFKEVTGELPKPLVPFGDNNATIDFPLSNAFNSGSTEILVLTQYKADMIEKYLHEKWQIIAKNLGTTIKALRSRRSGGYKGTADAVYQNRSSIKRANPDLVTILYADHIYSADYRHMQQAHQGQGADITIAAMQVPIADAKRYGVLEVDEFGNVIGFEEKPEHPKGVLTNPDTSFISLGIYIFSTTALLGVLDRDAHNPHSNHDFGKNIIPEMIGQKQKVIMHRFGENPVKGLDQFYWVDIGVPDDYHRAHMDIVGPNPRYKTDIPEWPLHIVERHTETPSISPNAFILNSKVSSRSIIGESRIANSVIFPGVEVGDYTEISDSVLLPGTVVREHTRIHGAITRDAHIGPHVYVGVFPSLSDKLNVTKTGGGIYIVTKHLHGHRN